MAKSPPPSPVIDASNLLAGLRELVSSRAHEARLLVQSGPVYMLFLRGEKHEGLSVEAVASARLPPEHKLSTERAKEMRQLGFEKLGGRRNWHKTVVIEEERLVDLAAESCGVLQRLYGADEPADLLLVEDELQHPQNPDLQAAMRQVARTSDAADRHRLYNALVNADLLVPLDPNAAGQGDGVEDFLVLEHDDGGDVYAAFTDWDALRKWQPRGWSYRAVHGSLLFETLVGASLGRFCINPDGDVGGELHAHEVEMLADAVRRHRQRFAN